MAMTAMMMIPILLVVIFPLICCVVIGIFVYRDASKRRMNKVLWALVAALTPAFVGLIIYLIVRESGSGLQCPGCGEPVTPQYAVCPQCGFRLRENCPQCGAAVEAGWKLCPQCAAPLPQTSAPVKKERSSLSRMLLTIIAVFLVLAVLLAVVGLITFGSGSGSINTIYNYAPSSPQVEEWLEQCRQQDPDGVYALRYQRKDGDILETQYLIYRPAAEHDTDISTSQSSSIFGAAVEVGYFSSTSPDSSGYSLLQITTRGNRYMGLKVQLDGTDLPVQVSESSEPLAPFVLKSSSENS